MLARALSTTQGAIPGQLWVFTAGSPQARASALGQTASVPQSLTSGVLAIVGSAGSSLPAGCKFGARRFFYRHFSNSQSSLPNVHHDKPVREFSNKAAPLPINRACCVNEMHFPTGPLPRFHGVFGWVACGCDGVKPPRSGGCGWAAVQHAHSAAAAAAAAASPRSARDHTRERIFLGEPIARRNVHRGGRCVQSKS
jgi:hypothetical protein